MLHDLITFFGINSVFLIPVAFIFRIVLVRELQVLIAMTPLFRWNLKTKTKDHLEL